MTSNYVSESLDEYNENQIREFAVKFLKNKNKQIKYYLSEKGKNTYRKASKRFYYNNLEKCRTASRIAYKKKLAKLGKKVRPTRGRPKKNEKNKFSEEKEKVVVNFD